MTTVYNQKVANGEVSFREFVMGCARNIDYLAGLRDSPEAKIPRIFRPRKDYYLGRLEQVKQRVQAIRAMSSE